MSGAFDLFQHWQKELACFVGITPKEEENQEDAKEEFTPLDWGEGGMLRANQSVTADAKLVKVADGVLEHAGIQILLPTKVSQHDEEVLEWLSLPAARRPSSMNQPVITCP
jgi:hypothetical protein